MTLPAAAPSAVDAALVDDLRAFFRRRLPESQVDDVLQNTLERIVRHADALHDEERFHAWVYRIARNAIADHYRARGQEPAPPPEAPDEPRTNVAPLAMWLRSAITKLEEPYCETLTLTELEELPYAEVAKRLDVSISAIKSRVQRGRDQLRKALHRCCKVELDTRGGIIDYQPRNCDC